MFVCPIITHEPQFASNFDWGTRENHGIFLSVINYKYTVCLFVCPIITHEPLCTLGNAQYYFCWKCEYFRSTRQSGVSKSRDHSFFKHLAETYANNHQTMRDNSKCRSWNFKVILQHTVCLIKQFSLNYRRTFFCDSYPTCEYITKIFLAEP